MLVQNLEKRIESFYQTGVIWVLLAELRHVCKRISCLYEHLKSVGEGNVKIQA